MQTCVAVQNVIIAISPMGGAHLSLCHCRGSSNYRCAECTVCGEEGRPEGKAVVPKGEPTFNVQKVPCEQELDSTAWTLGLYPTVFTKKGQKLLGAVQVRPGLAKLLMVCFQ